MASEITVTLSGSESEAQFNGANAWLRNDGAATVYAAKTAGVTAGADGVVAVPAGGSAPVYGANGRVFLTGTGSVQLIGSDYSTNPFKTSAQTGGSGADEVARAAVNTHAGNAEVHVTAAEKSAWNGKAEVSDIPTSLPANGGNAAALRTSGEDGTPYGDSYLMAAQYNKSGDNTFRIFVTPVEGNVVWVSVDRADHAVDSDTLDGKHASEFVMHSAYDELAARVAALEAKTQTEGT